MPSGSTTDNGLTADRQFSAGISATAGGRKDPGLGGSRLMNEARNAQAQLSHAAAANACREFLRNGAHYWVALMGGVFATGRSSTRNTTSVRSLTMTLTRPPVRVFCVDDHAFLVE